MLFRSHEDETYCVIARESVGEVDVSTVWLGEDNGRMFETMVFWITTGLNHRDEDYLPSWRYPTLAEALAGHKAEVERQRAKAGD